MSPRATERLRTAAVLIGGILLFFNDMFFRGTGFFYGDYRSQYYPWAVELSRALKRLTLPLWVDGIGCGFPLLAEGQAGALQPIKWVLYGLLPLDWGYPLSFFIPFFIAGWSTCSLLRRLGGSWSSGIVAALIFCYGSAYSGLAWGFASLWVLAWLPWAVDRAEALAQKPELRNVSKLAAVCALFWFGGFPQMALYASVFVWTYAVIRRPAVWIKAAIGCGLAVAAGAAQLMPTLELAAATARSATGLDFAMQKSLHPTSLVSLLAPGLGFWGSDLYFGVLPMILAVVAVWHLRRESVPRAMAAATVIALLMSLGKWNPVYVAAIKLFHLYSFRAPSKWALLALFGMAVLAGLGWNAWWKGESSRRSKILWAAGILMAILLIHAVAFCAARWAAPMIQQWAADYVGAEVYGKSGHPHSLEEYLSRIPGFLTLLKDRTRPDNYYVVCVLAASAAAGGWLILQLKKTSRQTLQALGLILIVTDLFLYSFVGSGFKGNRVQPTTIAQDTVTRYLQEQGHGKRVYEFVPNPLDPPRWMPNSNLIAGYPSMGIYTPLAPAGLAQLLRGTGAVDDSTGARAESMWIPAERLGLLSRLNVGYLISRHPLEQPGPWKEIIAEDDGINLYENPFVWPRAWRSTAGTRQAAVGTAQITESAPGFYRIRTDFEQPDSLVVTENAMSVYGPLNSGWRAQLDGRPAAAELYENLFLSVKVPAGPHQITFQYIPQMFRIGCAVSLAAFLIIAAGMFIGRTRRTRL